MTTNRERSLAYFAKEFGQSRDELLSEVNSYNTNYQEYGNEIYKKISSRVAHWWNFEDHNWFAKRVDIFLDRLAVLPEPLLIDVGFSIPYLHSDARFFDRTDIKALLIDKEENVIQFYRAISKMVPTSRQDKDYLLVGDIENQTDRNVILNNVKNIADKEPVKSILISACEVLEHLENIDDFWMLTRDLANVLPIQPQIYITLPIGEKIPSHNTFYLTEKDAINELERGMNIQNFVVLRPPPNASVSKYHAGCICAFGTVR